MSDLSPTLSQEQHVGTFLSIGHIISCLFTVNFACIYRLSVSVCLSLCLRNSTLGLFSVLDILLVVYLLSILHVFTACLSLSLPLFLSLSVCLSPSLSLYVCLSVSVFLCLSLYLSLSDWLSVCPPPPLSLSLSLSEFSPHLPTGVHVQQLAPSVCEYNPRNNATIRLKNGSLKR